MSDYEDEEGGFIEIDEEDEQNFDDFFNEFGEVNEEELEQEENVVVNEDEDEAWYDWMLDWFEFSDEEAEEIADEIVSGIYWKPDDSTEEEEGADEGNEEGEEAEYQEEALYSTQGPRLAVNVAGPGAPAGNPLASAVNAMKGAVLQFKEYLESPIGKQNKDKVKNLIGGLKAIFEGSAAMATVYYFFTVVHDETAEKQLAELKKIVEGLDRLDADIKAGFKDLMAHDEFRDFQRDVLTPTEILNRAYLKAMSFDYGDRPDEPQHPIEEFIAACENTLPSNLLATLNVFLAENCIILSHFEAKGYNYERMKQWENTVHNIADKLYVFNFTYYALKNREKPCDEAKAALVGELKFTDEESAKRKKRLAEIENTRLEKFNSTGGCEAELRKAFDEVKGDYPGLNADWLNYLGKAAERLRDKWKTVNGPSNFYVSVIRGLDRAGSSKLAVISEYHIGDPNKVVVARNAAFASDSYACWNDGVSVALIQPFTPEMQETQKTERANGRAKEIIGVLDRWCYNNEEVKAQGARLGYYISEINNIPAKPPLLMFYNTDLFTAFSSRYKHPAQEVAYAKRMVGEAATFDIGEGLSHKFDHHMIAGRQRQATNKKIRYLLQVVY